MKIISNSKEYTIHHEDRIDFLYNKLELQKDDISVFWVIDENVYNIYYHIFGAINKKGMYVIRANEENKTIECALQLCERMVEMNMKKNTQLISVGGGIIQDITGFVANIMYRGIKWKFIPTTLLAACDSCIGGKTSLNYKNYKNLLGTFYPPDDIYICPTFFETLSEQDFFSGLGEVLKFNIMRGEEQIGYIEEDFNELLKRNQKILRRYIILSLEFKKKFIEVDEYDQGIRKHLNFAHTFGHAIETITHYEIPHGTAVAMGILMANSISRERGYIKQVTKERIEDLVLQILPEYKFEQSFEVSNMIKAMLKDKKQENEQLRLVLLVNDELKLGIVEDVNVDEIRHSIYELKAIMNRKGQNLK